MHCDFRSYGSLSETVDTYFNIIADFLRHHGDGAGFSDDVVPLAGRRQVRGRVDRHRYIQFYLDESNRRQALPINNRVAALVDNQVFVKHGSHEDGRRQSITMTTAFATAFYAHVDETIGKLTEVTSPPTH